MQILIPVDGTDAKLSKVASRLDAKKWALVEYDSGVVQSTNFFDDRDQVGMGVAEFVVLKNKFESYMDFMEEGIMALVVREEETIEDIMEAFGFKELDEMGL